MEERTYLAQLNPQQLEAATHVNGPMLIIAGAGSGKTKTLVSRVCYLLNDIHVDPHNILLMTFTNKAAGEMKGRIVKACGEDGEKIEASTFHSFCARHLRQMSSLAGYTPNFTIVDSGDTRDIFDRLIAEKKKTMKENGISFSDRRFPSAWEISSICSEAVNSRISVKQAIIKAGTPNEYDDEVEEIIRDYHQYKKDRNSMDFDDLLTVLTDLVKNNEHVRNSMRGRYRYIMADEYQDTNFLQDELLRLLAGEEKNIVVVGDDNQSIYAFRGAKIQNILSFEKKFPGCRRIVLFENYRSSRQIADFANAVMSHSKEGIRKELKGQFDGRKPRMLLFDDRWAEARYIVGDIINKHMAGLPLREIGVITRGSGQTAAVEAQLLRENIPFEKFGGKKFWDKDSVRDILAFLRVTFNERDELAWYRLLKIYPRIGHVHADSISVGILKYGMEEELNNPHHRRFAYRFSLEEVYDTVHKLKKMDLHAQLNFLIQDYYEDLVTRMINESRMKPENKEKALHQLHADMVELPILTDLAKDYSDARRFLDDMALSFSNPEDASDKLNITTIHSAKGLEYDSVYIIDPIEGIFPRTREDCPEDREELRCLYVAITRAKKDLQICLVETYMQYGELKESLLSHHLAKDDIIDKTEHDERIRKMYPEDFIYCT